MSTDHKKNVPTTISTATTEYERRLLFPNRTYHVSRTNFASARNLQIKHDSEVIYNVHASSALFSTKTAVTVRSSDSSSGPVISTATLDSRKAGFTVSLGDEKVDKDWTEVTEDEDSILDRYFLFSARGQGFAWQNTLQHSVRVPTANGSEEETDGTDWKLVTMKGKSPKLEDQILAVQIHQKKSGESNIHWFEVADEDVERTSLAVLMGMLELKRKSEKEWRSGTALSRGL